MAKKVGNPEFWAFDCNTVKMSIILRNVTIIEDDNKKRI